MDHFFENPLFIYQILCYNKKQHGKRAAVPPLPSVLGEHILAYAAQGALKIPGNILPLGSGSDATLGIVLGFIIDPSANVAYIFHGESPFLFCVWFP